MIGFIDRIQRRIGMATTKPIRVFSRPWNGPASALNLDRAQMHGRTVTLQERALKSLLLAEKNLKSRRKPIPLIVVQSFRTHAEQKRIWNSGVRPAAPPGSSYHEQGLAVDMYFKAGDAAAIRKEMKKRGWHQFSVASDGGHFSYQVTG
jgi:hypothetical protein